MFFDRKVAVQDAVANTAFNDIKICYINPVSGNHAMASIAAFIQPLAQGFSTSRYRSTDATVFTLVDISADQVDGGVDGVGTLSIKVGGPEPACHSLSELCDHRGVCGSCRDSAHANPPLSAADACGGASS